MISQMNASPPKPAPAPQATKACVACKSHIPRDASLCSICKSYQLAWKNRLQYIASVVTLAVVSVSAVFWLYEKVRATFLYHEDVAIAECSTLLRTVVIANRGDRPVFVTRLQLWMPGRSSDWEAPYLEINQEIAPHQFLKAEFPKPRLDGGTVIRGMPPPEFEQLISKAANMEPCLELDYFASFDTHLADLFQMAGPTLNTFPVAGDLEYIGAKHSGPVRMTFAGVGVVRRGLPSFPNCEAPKFQPKPPS
jgi:hypothetical protein